MELQKALQEEMDNFMSTQFTHEVTKHFSHINSILRKTSPTALKIPLATYAELAKVTPGNVTLQQAGSCLNMLVTQTAASLDITLDEYLSFQEDIESGINEFNRIVNPERQRIMNKLQALDKVEQKSGRKIDMPKPAQA